MNIKRRKLKTKYTKEVSKKTRKILKKKGKNIFLKVLLWALFLFIVGTLAAILILYNKYIVGLPDIKQLENLEIAESSTIYDRDGNELYKIFKEKRTYVDFEDINTNMINAIIAIEDKRYWENPGVDIKGLARAGINYILGKTASVKGTSTLTQQLIRNTIITNERSVERKIKEIYLAYQLTSSVSKEKILELYLNKISYGHNAFGIEEAAKTFFNKSAKELEILESSIIASLPKGPTFYSPYNHPDRVVGYPYVYTSENEDDIEKIISKKDKETHIGMLDLLTDFILELKASRLEGTNKTLICNINKEYFKNPIRVDNDGCSIIEYSGLLHFLNSIKIENEENFIEYQTGRKDEVLGRMLEDGYIDFESYQNAIVNAIGYKFSQAKENIKSPHFVFFVKEYLEEKYGKEIVSVGGLKIYTTLDPDLQAKAEEILEKQAEINEQKFAASNAALVSLDNKTGEILAMVGGRDYFDEENKGNVNVVTSKLQPGSTFKPFVYSMGIFNEEIGSKTPIYDVETEFPSKYIPANFDGKFMGKMSISTALNNSRNIPAVKMFFLAGGERSIVSFMKKIGVDSLRNHGMYGAPLALGTGEMTPLELATAYSTFANMGMKKEITPILKVLDVKGNIVEEAIESEDEEEVISPAQTYIMNSILSDTSSRPEFWNTILGLKDRAVAAKTGTSTKQYMKNGEKDIYPANLWTAGYTPQITTVVWAGNTDGEKLNYKGNGLEGAGPIWKEFMEYAHEGLPKETWEKPSEVKEINISTLSGLLPNPETSSDAFLTKSLFINEPSTYDNSYRSVEVDSLCNGEVTESTPEAAIKKVNLLQLNSLAPKNTKWQEPVEEWTKTEEFKEQFGNIENIITKLNPACERSGIPSDITIRTTTSDDDTFVAGENYIELAYRSSNPIIRIDILVDDKIVDEIEVNNRKSGSYAGNIFIPISQTGKYTNITMRAVDNEYYSESITSKVFIIKKDSIPPEIKLVNPIDGSIKLYESDYFNLKATITDNTPIKTINIKLDGNIIKAGLTDKDVVYPINSERNISVGQHVITIEAIDSGFNKAYKDIKLEVLAR